MFDEDYYGKEEYELYRDLVVKNLSGLTVSKARDEAYDPGGLIYEAEQLGLDWKQLLRCLEGLCYNGEAQEINDHTYYVF